MNDIFKKRHSTKFFLDKKVEEEKVDEIIQAGLLAPSGRGTQNALIVEITNEEVIEKLAHLNAKIGQFPAGVNPFYGSKTVLLVLVKKCSTDIYDGCCVMENMLLEAADLNIGACWIHRAKEEVESEEGKEILSSLGLNLNDYIGVGHVVLGYMKNEPIAKPVKEGRVLYIK